MSDYNFMQSGLGEARPGADPHALDFMQKVASILRVLTEQAMHTACAFCKACGRSVVVERDVALALKYEAHEFFKRDIEQRFDEALSNERTHSYESEEDSEDGGSDEESAEESTEEEEEAYTQEFVVGDERARQMHAQMRAYGDSWCTWQPEDPIAQLMKNSIDRAEMEARSVP